MEWTCFDYIIRRRPASMEHCCRSTSIRSNKNQQKPTKIPNKNQLYEKLAQFTKREGKNCIDNFGDRTIFLL